MIDLEPWSELSKTPLKYHIVTVHIYIVSLSRVLMCICVWPCACLCQVQLHFHLHLCTHYVWLSLPGKWTVPGGINCNPFHKESSLSGNPQALVPLSKSFIFLSLQDSFSSLYFFSEWSADEVLLRDKNIPPFLWNCPEGLVKDSTLWVIRCIC